MADVKQASLFEFKTEEKIPQLMPKEPEPVVMSELKYNIPKKTALSAITRTCLDKYKFLPESIWEIEGKDERLTRFISDSRAEGSYSDKSERKTKLSMFHPEVARRIVVYWSREGDTIFDSCFGGGTRLFTAVNNRRHYIGNDVCVEFFKQLRENIINQKTLDGSREIVVDTDKKVSATFDGKIMGEIRLQDSRQVDLPDNYVDFVYTSPPYYCVEWYSDDPGQIGNTDSYDKFMKELKKIIAESYRVLRPSRYAVFVVNDIRYKGMLYNFHGDTINVCKEVGYTHWDTIIYNLWSLSLQGFTMFDLHNYCAKAHEYILVMKKPPVDKYLSTE